VIGLVFVIVGCAAIPVAVWKATGQLGPWPRLSDRIGRRWLCWTVGFMVYAAIQVALALPGWSGWMLDHGGPLALGVLAAMPLAPAVIAGGRWSRNYR
jgi:hypothetical protein